MDGGVFNSPVDNPRIDEGKVGPAIDDADARDAVEREQVILLEVVRRGLDESDYARGRAPLVQGRFGCGERDGGDEGLVVRVAYEREKGLADTLRHRECYATGGDQDERVREREDREGGLRHRRRQWWWW